MEGEVQAAFHVSYWGLEHNEKLALCTCEHVNSCLCHTEITRASQRRTYKAQPASLSASQLLQSFALKEK